MKVISLQFQYQTSFTIKDEIGKRNAAILPIGAVEAHGPHLPIGTDNLLAERLADELGKRTDSLVLPLLPYGQVWSLKHFPGSIHVSNESIISMIVDIGRSVREQGFRVLAIVNGHLGNMTAIKEAARKLHSELDDLKIYYFFYSGTSQVIDQVRESPKLHGQFFHACEIETSYMLYMAPEYVNMSLAPEETPLIPETVDVTPTPWENFTATSVLGNAKLATREKGEKIIESALQYMALTLERAKQI